MSYPVSFPATEPVVTLTYPKPYLWVIELHNGYDNRLTTRLIDEAIKPALDAVERHWREQWRPAQQTKDKADGKGAVIIVGKKDQNKFFSNGLDFATISQDTNFFPHVYNPLLTRLLTFPLPTIAAINGHCYAGGMMLSLACDYRVMTDGSKRNTWITMNEVHFGATWPLSFAAVLRTKLPSNSLVRSIALEGKRFSPIEARDAGIIDDIVPGEGGAEAVLARAEQIADSVMANASHGVWGLIKSNLYRDTLETIVADDTVTKSAALARARL